MEGEQDWLARLFSGEGDQSAFASPWGGGTAGPETSSIPMYGGGSYAGGVGGMGDYGLFTPPTVPYDTSGGGGYDITGEDYYGSAPWEYS